MNSSTPQITNTKFVEIVRTYWAWRRLWSATTIAFGSIGLIYVLFLKSDTWTASQGLIVRDEANGAVMRLGRFQSQTEMKAAQETILEMARNNQVLHDALLDVGPEAGWFSHGTISKDWPSQSEVTSLADQAIGVRAPQGAEFGTTEVIYLDIKQKSRTRALELNRAVCRALDNRLRLVRIARADGVIDELTRASTMAGDELRKATERLQIIEREAGPDLADLRGLSEANGNGSTSRQMLDAVKTELRQLENQHNQLLTDRNLLSDTQVDPERLLSAPASILTAHPGLKKLREGLADAQLASSQLRGRFTTSHPLVYVALTSEKEIKGQLQVELALALATTEKDVENSQARIDNLKRQQRQLEERLERLARMRADHDNLNNEVRARTRIHQDADKQLADARASRDAAMSSSLLTRLDEPVLGERPAGPGRSTILVGMTVAGLFFGLGIVFLLTPLDGNVPQSDRWNEKLGRRISDRFPWLADADSTSSAPRRRRSDQNRRQVDRSSSAMLTPSEISAMAPRAASPFATTEPAAKSTGGSVAAAQLGGLDTPAKVSALAAQLTTPASSQMTSQIASQVTTQMATLSLPEVSPSASAALAAAQPRKSDPNLPRPGQAVAQAVAKPVQPTSRSSIERPVQLAPQRPRPASPAAEPSALNSAAAFNSAAARMSKSLPTITSSSSNSVAAPGAGQPGPAPVDPGQPGSSGSRQLV